MEFSEFLKNQKIMRSLVYLEGISSKFGMRRFSLVSTETGGIKEEISSSYSFKRLVLATIKLISYSSVLVPVCMLIGKLICRSQKTYHIINSPTPEQEKINDISRKTLLKSSSPSSNKESILKAQRYLNDLWINYKEKHSRSYSPSKSEDWQGIFLNLKLEFSHGPIATVTPDDHSFSNLLLTTEHDPEIFSIPHLGINPRISEEMMLLKKILEASFLTGKKMVIGRLCNSKHSLAVGFCSDGSFKIIDSLSRLYGKAIDLKDLTTQLNKAAIKNVKGQPIQFQGEYIHTGIQKGGHECIRFASLYGYQMAKKKDLNAFEEVNGAFVEGKLKTFEDYAKIDGSQRMRYKQIFNYSYKEFMSSWAYRTQGIRLDSWKNLSLKTIHKNFDDYQNGKMAIYGLENDKNTLPYLLTRFLLSGESVSIDLYFKDQNGQETLVNTMHSLPLTEVPLPENYEEFPLKHLLSPIKGSRSLLVFEKDQPKPHLYQLSSGQDLYLLRKTPYATSKNFLFKDLVRVKYL